MTFDTIEELNKIKAHYPEAECVLRIATEASTAIYNLSEKYGAPMELVPEMLKVAKELGLRVKGVAFHTGSGGVTANSYESSLLNVRKIFDMVKVMGMEPMDLIDIGGGFTLVNPDKARNFDHVAPIIGAALDRLFPERNIRCIAEPGRYISESVVYLATTIIGAKTLASGSKHYYLDSGVYQGFALRPYGEEQFIQPVNDMKRPQVLSTFWGQTCDSCDWIIKDKMHPEYKTGEWVISRDFGAYNTEIACKFNGYDTPQIVYI
jgi:ornithine decarboxylase